MPICFDLTIYHLGRRRCSRRDRHESTPFPLLQPRWASEGLLGATVLITVALQVAMRAEFARSSLFQS